LGCKPAAVFSFEQSANLQADARGFGDGLDHFGGRRVANAPAGSSRWSTLRLTGLIGGEAAFGAFLTTAFRATLAIS
jgi:hypothetical protein